MLRYQRAILFFLFLLLFSSLGLEASWATPVARIEMVYVRNLNGTFTYFARVTNVGPPLFTESSTPPGHTLTAFNGTTLDAGGKPLNEDQYLVAFGLDTLSDDLIITNIRNASTAFIGTVENGFHDTDGDGTRNQAIAWHLPNTFTQAQTIQPGQVRGNFSFTLNREVKEFEFFVTGTDDLETYIAFPVAGVDDYGHYDGALQRYFSTFLTVHARAAAFRLGG
jgi:hypothetical protein